MSTEERRAQIRSTDLFICLVPDEPFDGTEGDADLRYAIELGKPIVVLLLPERSGHGIPSALKGYNDFTVAASDIEAAGMIRRRIGNREVKITDGGWDPPGSHDGSPRRRHG